MFNSVEKYAAPKLTVYGSMVKLTASGLLGSCENGNIVNGGTQCGGPNNVVNPAKRN